MKNLKQKIFLGVLIFVLIVLGVEIYSGYMGNHTYYQGMLRSWTNWKLLIWVVVSAAIPVLTVVLSKKFSLRNFLLSLLGGLFLFSLIHVGVKAEIMGVGGFVVLLINTILLFSISTYFILGNLALGSWISEKVLNFKELRRQEMFINFGIGLGVFLLFVRFLLITNLFFGVILWVLFLGLGVLVYFQRKKLSLYKDIVEGLFSGLNRSSIRNNAGLIVGVVLLTFSIIYYYYGFQLSFIPYSTAWDANHAYMYLPKIWMQNNGVFWGNGPGGYMPGLWHTFIAFWFGLTEPLKGFWLAPDTMAVAMNFLSGLFVLIFGLGLIKEVVGYISNKLKSKIPAKEAFWKLSKQIAIYAGWMALLLWLTSGMGAFLVFVDNKTDLGVMSMIILAMLSGFIFLRYLAEHKKTSKGLDKETIKYIVVSGAIFALAALAKPTAVIDIALFGLLVASLWFGGLIGLGGGLIALGAVAKLQLVNASDILSTYSALPTYLLGAGFVLILLGIGLFFVKNKNNKSAMFQGKKKLGYLGIWVLAYLVMMFVTKAPVLVVNYVQNGGFSASSFVKRMFLSQQTAPSQNVELNKTLLAATTDITIQNNIDSSLENNFENVSLEECKTLNFSEEELLEGLREPPKGNADVGRYVGYGYKAFNAKRGLFNFGNLLLRLIYSQDMKCYGTNTEAKTLCENKYAVDAFHVPTMRILFDKMDSESEVYEILSGALARFDEKGLAENDPNVVAVMRTEVVTLRQYYQDHAASRDFNPQAIRSTFDSVGMLLNQFSDKNNAGVLIQKLQVVQQDIEAKYTQKLLTRTDLKKGRTEMLSILDEIENELGDGNAYATSKSMVKNLPDQFQINVPYRYLIPLNVVYNRSLQNLSSYYTDIGFVWLIFFIFVIAGLAYGLITNHKKLTMLSLMTITGRGVWWIIGGGIVWYGIGLMMWTILVFAVLCKELLSDSEDKHSRSLFFVMIGVVVMRGLIQFFLNFMRIASQGAGGPFVRYKMSAGMQMETTLQLSQEENIKYGFGQQDVFDMQFGHYNLFIESVADRADEDGVLVAGTYLPYFLNNQTNLTRDGMLGAFWKLNSDGSSCRSYHRLKDKNLTYLVIDPNISSVVQGEGNESLFNKFFAKRNPLNGLIEDHGAITMLVKLWREGYLDLAATNNLGAKYAFELSDQEIKSAFFVLDEAKVIKIANSFDIEYQTGVVAGNQLGTYKYDIKSQSLRFYGKNNTIILLHIDKDLYGNLDRSLSFEDEVLFTRAKMVVPNPRFFNDAQQLMVFISTVFDRRVTNGEVIDDIASVYGYTIDEQLVLETTQKVLMNQGYPDTKIIEVLTESERRVLLKYIEFYRLKQMKDPRYQQAVQNLLGASIGSSSQYVAFKLK